MADSSNWFFSYSTKLRFFSRIRRFIRIKAASKCIKSSEQHNEKAERTIFLEAQDQTQITMDQTEIMIEQEGSSVMMIEQEGSSSSSASASLNLLQRSVKQLHFGSWEEKEMATKEITRLAKQDLKTRKSLAVLGVIPSLMSMLDSEIPDRRRLAIQPLIELANGTFTNKALMVEAGILSKLPRNVVTVGKSTRHDFALLVLSISSLANTQFPIASTEVLPFLIGVLDSDSSVDAKKACLGALYNLSAMLDNVGSLVSNGVVNTLLGLSTEKELADKALAILGNLVVTVMGKKAIENDAMVPESLIGVLTWEEKPKCQELAAYILMILAHQSSEQRTKMSQLGIVPVLLEVALLGSPLAQKRALKILQWFKDERQTRIGAHSGPQTRAILIGSPIDLQETKEGKRIIKKMVKQSLDKNMELITRRANGAVESCKLTALVFNSSSKSLPY